LKLKRVKSFNCCRGCVRVYWQRQELHRVL
jgi:hypothetical protein